MPKLLLALTAVQHRSLAALATSRTTSMQRLAASAIETLLESNSSIRPTTGPTTPPAAAPDPLLKILAAVQAIANAATANSPANLAALLKCKALVKDKEAEFKRAENTGAIEPGIYRSLAASLTMRCRHMKTWLNRTPH